jgi:hypothetical protein
MLSAMMSAMLSASLSLEPRILILAVDDILSRSRLTNSREISGDPLVLRRCGGDQWRSVEISGDPLVLRRCGANRERERGREGERGSSRGTVDLVMMERGG